jgi:sec-independent protein translocase protein TatA
MYASLSVLHIILVLVIVIVFFGPGRIEKLGPALGKALRGFKKGIADELEDDGDGQDAKLVKDASPSKKAKSKSKKST